LRTIKGDHYGHTSGNLANLKEGKFEMVVGSPPYADQHIQKNSGAIDRKKQYKTYRSQGGGASFEAFCKTQELHSGDYGHSLGQLGALKEGSIDAVISSPPYEGCQYSGIDCNPERMMKGPCAKTSHGGGRVIYERQATKGNLGSDTGDTFWSASREIVQQCFDLLKSGGHAIWVCKDYVKNKQRVPFSDRWLALCESVGFKLVCRHQAMLKKDYGQINWVNDQIKLIKERKSFFRRNSEDKATASKFWSKINTEIQNEYIEKARTLVTYKPTEKKIIQKAQTLLWKDFLRPVEEIETGIYWEDVLCFRKENIDA